MEIKVKRSMMVQPAEDTPKHRLWLSNLELARIINHHVPLVYFYKSNGSSNFFKIRLLKDALSNILVPFYTLAGRFGTDKNGRLEIICNANGVLFVETEATAAIDDLGDFAPSSQLRQLVPTVDYSRNISSYPLIMLHVTTFKCGGICVGVGIHDVVLDGTSAFYFINSWCETVRGLPLKVLPLIDRTLLRARVPPTPKFHHVEYDPSPSLDGSISTPELQPSNKPSSVSILKITSNQVNTLKAKAGKKADNPNYSTFNILAAHIWRCVSKARVLLDDQATKLYIPTNGRPRLQPPLPPSYLGNVIFWATSIALSGNLKSESFTNTIERIHKSIKQMDNEYMRSALDYLETVPNMTTLRGANTFKCPSLSIINWMGLHLHEADFGWRRPIYMGPAYVIHEGKIYLLLNPTMDGSLSLIACLQNSHMELFQKHFYEGLMSIDQIKARF
ncbi:hypothetical protein REPUB_Repub18cG0158300 [Reevesia pubescens]